MPADNAETTETTDHGPTATAEREAGGTATTRVDVNAARAALKDVPHEPGAKKPDPIVVADGIRRTFGGLTAVDVRHLEVQRGTITALIGPNGAGKTTFFNLITGFDQPNSGSWTFDGTPMGRLRPYQVAGRGMVRTRLDCLEFVELTRILSYSSRWDADLPAATVTARTSPTPSRGTTVVSPTPKSVSPAAYWRWE